MSWSQKYEPESLEDFAGQNKQLKKLRNWSRDWSPGDDAILLHGPPGDGKTSSVYALANDEDLEIMELNASDKRNRKEIEELAGSASQQRSLLGKEKIILVDEVDGLSGRSDRGGVGAIIKVIKKSKFPVVLTANDPYDKKLRSLRRYCKLVDFGKVHLNSMTAQLSKICEKEGVEAERKVLKQIARQNSGDLRSAINDLETIARNQSKISEEDLNSLGYRERKKSIFQALKVIFKTKTCKTSKNMLDNVDKDPDEIFWWIEQNIPKEYENGKEVAEAFEQLSMADIFKTRIHRRQNWALMKYMLDLMSAGVSLSKEKKYKKFTKYQPPQRLKRYGRSKGQRKILEDISEKLKDELHISSSKLKTEYLPLFKWMFEKEGNWKEEFKEEFNFTEEEMEAIESF